MSLGLRSFLPVVRANRQPHRSFVPLLFLLIAVASGLVPCAWATPAATTTLLSVSPSSPQLGGVAETLTATVTGSGAVHPGTVNFYDITNAADTNGGSPLKPRPALIGTAQLQSNGTASIKVILPGATHTLTAVFVGTTAAATSTSAAETFVVNGNDVQSVSLTASSSPSYPAPLVQMDVNLNYNGLSLPDGSLNFTNVTQGNVFGSTSDFSHGSSITFNQNATAASTGAYGIAVADLNDDGNRDLVATSDSSAVVSVYLGNGDGTMRAPVSYPVYAAGAHGVVIGDFNNDGHPDIAVSNTSSGSVSVLLGNGDGTFQPNVEFAVSSGPGRIAVGDFNQDGNLDLAVACGTNVSVLLGTGTGSFSAVQNFAVDGSDDLAVADLNLDGKADILTSSTSTQRIDYLQGNGDGTFQPKSGMFPPGGQLPVGIAVADFNGDGIPDLAVADTAGYVNFGIGTGTGTFTQASNQYYGIVGGQARYVTTGASTGTGGRMSR